MRDLINTLRKEFHRSEDYRYAYDEEFANTLVATQIKVLRESHDPPLTQKQLAERAGMKQSRISELENVAYSAWSMSTLRRLARALGVRLVFKFESWGELLPEIETFSRRALEKPSFENDPAFTHAAAAEAGAHEDWAQRLSREHAEPQSSFFNRLERGSDGRRSQQKEEAVKRQSLGEFPRRQSA